jgi:hypothetical protein
MNLAEAIDVLLPRAQHRGMIDDSTEAQYDALEWCDERPKPSWADCLSLMETSLKVTLRDQVDALTDQMIAEGMLYEGIRFKLDVEHQMSYKGVYDFRSFISFPYTVKGEGENYLSLADEAELATFVLAGFQYLESIIKEGWTIKAELVTLSYDQLRVWEDPRLQSSSSGE